jgi:tetratricopeptide (TPR) repeat protein/predicted Ser/Thr protein kinase
MTPARWAQMKDVYSAAMEKPPAERDAFLDEACPDASLREEVGKLLAAEDRPPLESPLAGVLGRGLLPAAIGRYRIIRVLGEGGMGVVYEAEQDQPHRKVAIKAIRAGLADPAMLRRFEHEAQALGRLHHPGIAQIYEAGTADTGFGPQPYFAMEFIQGTSLLHHAAEQGLDTRARLELMAKVCDAVEHAHQRGIIHRDLKPGNILVDESGQPKIVDFGVARATGSDVQTTLHTGYGQILGTLAYMSPEQVLADPLELDTRSDVYALGVILFELLAGRLPYQLSDQIAKAVQTIQEDDPARLSSIDRAYRGDIETIVGKALEKDKSRRYGSAAELAADIRRYLNDEPILARRSTAAYHLRKFARRNRALVAGIAAAAVMLVAGTAVSAWEAARARAERTRADRRFQDVRKLAHAVVFEFHDAIRDLPGATHARELLAKRALEYLDSLAAESGGDTSLQLELADAYEKIGAIQFTANGASHLGEQAGAMASQQKALAIRKAILASNPGSTAAKAGLASSYLLIGDLRYTQGEQDASSDYRQAIRIGEELVAAQPSDRSLRMHLALAYREMGDMLVGNTWFRHRSDVVGKWGPPGPSADVQGALANYQKMRALFGQLAKEQPQDLTARALVADGYQRLASVRAAQNDFPAALELLRDALAVSREVYERRPNDVHAVAGFITLNDFVGNALVVLGHPAAAMSYYAKALALREPLAAADPTNAGAHEGLLWSYMEMSYVSAKAGRQADARLYTSRLIAAQKVWAERPGATADDWEDYAWTLLTCDPPGLRQPALGLAAAKRAVEMSASRDPDNLDTLALAWFRTGDRTRAIKTEREALALAGDPSRRKEFEATLHRFENGRSEPQK